MRLHVSLTEEDIEFIDAFGRAQRLPSRSAVLRTAVRLLRAVELGPAFDDGAVGWDRTDADGDEKVPAAE